jgi:hypothetical protein
MISFAIALPEHSNDGYVAAAYIVFLAIVLVYVVIMAIRLGRVERKIEELRSDTNHGDLARAHRAPSGEDPNPQTLDRSHPQSTEQERTLKGAGETV